MVVQNKYTMEEVAKHCKNDDQWLIIEDAVYNTTRYQHSHPGGAFLFQGTAGSDVTLPFSTYHACDEQKLAPIMKSLKIGTVVDRPQSKLTLAFEELHQKLKDDNMYTYDSLYYVKVLSWYFSIFAVAVKLLTSRVYWQIILGSVFLGCFWQQIAFLGHDVGHNSATQTLKGDWYFGLIVNLFFGVSGAWWKFNHNAHHVYCNSVNWDPTVQHLPLFALNDSFARGYWSFYHSKFFQSGPITQFMLGYQHFLYIPVLCFARWKMYISSFDHLITVPNVYGRKTEFTALCLFWVWHAYLLSCIPTIELRLWCMLISHCVTGLLHMQITLNHFIMPTYEGRGFDTNNDGDHWIKMQLETSADVGCGESLDWLWGGLQFQAAHHLFPRIPRANLRKLREEYLVPFCKKFDLNYEIAPGLFGTTLEVLKVLSDEAERIRGGEVIPLDKSTFGQLLAESIVG